MSCTERDDPEDPSLLSADDEVRLAQAVEAGVLARERRECGDRRAAAGEWAELERRGDQAQRRLVAANLGLVGLVVGRIAPPTAPWAPDLYQDGCLGLIEAVRRFDHRRGYRFATYALVRIRAAVSDSALKAQAQPGFGAFRVRERQRLHRTQAELTQRLGRTVDGADLAAHLACDPARVQVLLHPHPVVTIESVADLLVDPVVPGPPADLVDLLERLDPLHRDVVALRFGFGADGQTHSLREIAQRTGSTLSKVRRIEREAMDRLRSLCPSDARLEPAPGGW